MIEKMGRSEAVVCIDRSECGNVSSASNRRPCAIVVGFARYKLVPFHAMVPQERGPYLRGDPRCQVNLTAQMCRERIWNGCERKSHHLRISGAFYLP